MTISGIIICSTCGHKIRLRHQVGYVYPAVVKIPCNRCGKIIKGHVKKGRAQRLTFQMKLYLMNTKKQHKH